MMSLIVETRVSIALLTLAHWPTVVIPLEVALTNVCAWTFVVLPTLNVIVVASAARISKLLPDAGSVDLGYPTSDEVTAPTLTVIVVPVTALIARHGITYRKEDGERDFVRLLFGCIAATYFFLVLFKDVLGLISF